MICTRCKKDREAGYSLGNLFFCLDCGTETIFSLVGDGIGQYVDTTVDIPSENVAIDGTPLSNSDKHLNAVTVVSSENDSYEASLASCSDEECASSEHENPELCVEYSTEAPDFTPPCDGENIV